jgi:prepilin-type N-terminal cleavage/methylation domain-containing protein
VTGIVVSPQAQPSREGGFTLIELLVVLVLIGVLLAIAFPSYLGYRERAELRTAQANLRAAVPAVEAYFADNGTYADMDVADLTAIDASVRNDGTNGIFVVSGNDSTYCLRSVHASGTAFKDGPSADITGAACA